MMKRNGKRCGVTGRKTVLLTTQVVILLCFAPLVMAQTRNLPSGPRPTSTMYEGFTIPKHEILVAASELGRLKTMEVKVGDKVRDGELLGSLEDSTQVSAVRIASAKANMTGELEAVRAEHKLAQLRVLKLRELASEKMARPDELARAEADLEIAQGRMKATEEQILLNKLELERHQVALRRRKILAPMSGIIADVLRLPGEYVTPADPAVVRLLVVDQVYAVFNIPVSEASRVTVNSPAKVYLRGAERTIDAVVSTVAPMIDGESGTVEVRLEINNTDHQIKSGDRCTLQVFPRQKQAKRVHPKRAVMDTGSVRK